MRSRVDVVEQRFLRAIGEVHAPDGDGHHVGAGGSCASAITACDGYLPVPTMSRELKVRPAMTRGSRGHCECQCSCELALFVARGAHPHAPDRPPAGCCSSRRSNREPRNAERATPSRGARYPPPTKFTISTSSPSLTTVEACRSRLMMVRLCSHGHAARIDGQLFQQLLNRQRRRQFFRLAVEPDLHVRTPDSRETGDAREPVNDITAESSTDAASSRRTGRRRPPRRLLSSIGFWLPVCRLFVLSFAVDRFAGSPAVVTRPLNQLPAFLLFPL